MDSDGFKIPYILGNPSSPSGNQIMAQSKRMYGIFLSMKNNPSPQKGP